MKFYEKIIAIILWEIFLFMIIYGYFYDLKKESEEDEIYRIIQGQIYRQDVLLIKLDQEMENTYK